LAQRVFGAVGAEVADEYGPVLQKHGPGAVLVGAFGGLAVAAKAIDLNVKALFGGYTVPPVALVSEVASAARKEEAHVRARAAPRFTVV
jgi:hypothetical protein